MMCSNFCAGDFNLTITRDKTIKTTLTVVLTHNEQLRFLAFDWDHKWLSN